MQSELKKILPRNHPPAAVTAARRAVLVVAGVVSVATVVVRSDAVRGEAEPNQQKPASAIVVVRVLVLLAVVHRQHEQRTPPGTPAISARR